MSPSITARDAVAVLLACSAATLGAQTSAEMVGFDLSKGQAFERRFAAAPGGFVEWCGTLRRGLALTWRFDADGPLDSNIHYHDGDQVTSPAGGTLPAVPEGACSSPSINRGNAPVTLRARLRDESKRAKPRGTALHWASRDRR